MHKIGKLINGLASLIEKCRIVFFIHMASSIKSSFFGVVEQIFWPAAASLGRELEEKLFHERLHGWICFHCLPDPS